MENGNSGGNIGTGDAAVLALLADTARAGRGGYWGGEGGHGGYGAYATPTGVQRTIECGLNQVTAQSNMQGQIANQQALMAAIGSISSGIAGAESRTNDRIRDNQLNLLRESADLSRQLAACCCETQKGFLQQSLEQQKCCCETQKLIHEDGQKTRDLVNQNTIRAATDANNISATVGAINASAAANTAAIVSAIRETCARPPHHPC
jgi:hypothetical protein